MQHFDMARLSSGCTVTNPARCPHCGDWMVAPIHSEFVDNGEIRHHWECESCGEPSSISIPLTSH
jgi:hypothetical protein